MNNLTFRQLRVFQELMRSGSLANTARALHRTQPAISIMLSNLEKELGFQLFERRNRRLIPKPEAQYMLEEVDAVLGRLHQSIQTMQEVADLKRGQLKIACMPAATLAMTQLVAVFSKDKPELQVSLMVRSSKVIVDWVASQQYDMGLAEIPPNRDSVNCQAFRFSCLCALSPDDPLASQAVITPDDLSGKPLATLFPEHTTSKQVEACFRAADADYRVRFELQTFLPGLELAAQGLCYCICDPISAQGYQSLHENPELINIQQGLVFIPFLPEVSIELAILTPAHRASSEVCKAFYAFTEQALQIMDKSGQQ